MTDWGEKTGKRVIETGAVIITPKLAKRGHCALLLEGAQWGTRGGGVTLPSYVSRYLALTYGLLYCTPMRLFI